MNITILSLDPATTAREMCDKDVCGAAWAYGQIASDALHRVGFRERGLYPARNLDDPATKWAALQDVNFQWFVVLAKAVWAEYTYRYGKTHGCQLKLEHIITSLSATNGMGTKYSTHTCPPQEMPDKYRKLPTAKVNDPWLLTIQANREYYIQEKSKWAKWTKRPIPDWYASAVAKLVKPVASLPVEDAPRELDRLQAIERQKKYLFKKIAVKA